MLALLVVGGCASRPPDNVNSICDIFRQKQKWYKAAQRSENKWGTPVHVQMAIIWQESKFRFDARPPRRKKLGFIPWTRPSDAYGFAQVKDSTWDWYQTATGQRGADRDDFSDAIDFVGWYTNQSQRQLGISKWNPYQQYLAYHEGHGGYQKQSFNGKPWLLQVARKLDHTAKEWGAELRGCEEELDDGWWFF